MLQACGILAMAALALRPPLPWWVAGARSRAWADSGDESAALVVTHCTVTVPRATVPVTVTCTDTRMHRDRDMHTGVV